MREALKIVKQKLIVVINNLKEFAERNKNVTCLGYTHFQPAQLTTVGKRATLWMQDLLEDLEELEFVEEHMKLLGCKGTTGTQELTAYSLVRYSAAHCYFPADYYLVYCPYCSSSFSRHLYIISTPQK